MTKIRHDVMLRLVKVLDVVMITLPFAACWIWYYAAKHRWMELGRAMQLFWACMRCCSFCWAKPMMRSGCPCSEFPS